MIINKDIASLEERVYTALEEAILSGELKKGEALTELGVSESSVSAARRYAVRSIASRRKDSLRFRRTV